MRSLVILTFVLAALTVRAQIHSAAFDPNCYQPKIGVEIDTILGAVNDQWLGDGLINIGPSPENPRGSGRLMMRNLFGHYDTTMTILEVGPTFNPENPNRTKQPCFNIDNPIPGHYRSQKYIDLLTTAPNGDQQGRATFPRIYWQSDSGTYDSSRYTILKPEPLAYPLLDDKLSAPYHAYLTSDTVEDIIFLYIPTTPDGKNASDSEFAALYRGGSDLVTRSGDTLLANEHVYVDSDRVDRLSYIGDFRGIGRQDLITLDTKCNLFFYHNDRPFDLTRFAHSLKNDTLLAGWMEPWLSRYTFAFQSAVIRMREGDPQSLAIAVDSAAGTPNGLAEIRIVEGGPDFGKQRISLANTLVLHSPDFFDRGNFRNCSWNDGAIFDCGPIAGTSDHVLFVAGHFLDHESFYTFYTLGSSFDEKIDMYFQEDGYDAGPSIDTATLDNDGIPDIVIDAPLLPELMVNGVQNRGSLLFVHGSTRIPVKNRSVKHPASSNEDIWAWQSSDGKWLSLHLPDDEVGPCHIVLRDILGRPVCELTQEVTTAPRMLLPPHPAGTYILQVTIGEKLYQRKLAIM